MKLESYWLDTALAQSPAIPAHFAKPWFLPLAGACYRVQDILH